MVRKKFKTLQTLFKNENRWCKFHYAETKDGKPLYNEQNKSAVRFCLLGGVGVVYGSKYNSIIRGKLVRAINKLYPSFRVWYNNHDNMTMFNDHRKTTIQRIRRVVKEANV